MRVVHKPTAQDPVFHIRLESGRLKDARGMAAKLQLPVSTWMRMVITQHIDKERGNAK